MMQHVKMMHVSPFMQMHYEYIFDWGYPSRDGWDVRWELRHIPHSMTPLQWDKKGIVSYAPSPSSPSSPSSSSTTKPTIDSESEPPSRHVIPSCPFASSRHATTTSIPKGHVAVNGHSASSSPSSPSSREHKAKTIDSTLAPPSAHGSSLIPRDRIHMKVSMSLQCAIVDQRSLLWILYRHPAMTLKVTFGIYWEAFVLFARKGATFFTHPNPARRWGS